MKRRSPIALLALAVATLTALTTSCTTFSDSDAAARVGDVEFTHDELVAQLEELGVPPEQLAQADIARGQVSAWVAERVVEAQDPVLAAEIYADGLFASGSICLDVIATDSQAAADDAVAALESGTTFADAFAAANTDPSLAESLGRIGCLPLAELDLEGGNPLVDSITDINADNPYAIALLPGDAVNPDLFVVSRFVPFDELGPDETPVVTGSVVSAEALGLDIYIDPRIGTYDDLSGSVVPLV